MFPNRVAAALSAAVIAVLGASALAGQGTAPVLNKGVRAGPLTLAPPRALQAPTLSFEGPYTSVGVVWQPLPEPSTYLLRRSTVDPATLPADFQAATLTGPGVLEPNRWLMLDQGGDLHLPTWYKLSVSNGTGSGESPWYRRDPPIHAGVDTIIGGYWRVPSPSPGGSAVWTGCLYWSAVPGASDYWIRMRSSSGAWLTLPPNSPFAPHGGSMYQIPRVTGFSAGPTSPLFQSLEKGEVLIVQAGANFAWTDPRLGSGSVSDMNHAPPVVLSFTKTTPRDLRTCHLLP